MGSPKFAPAEGEPRRGDEGSDGYKLAPILSDEYEPHVRRKGIAGFGERPRKQQGPLVFRDARDVKDRITLLPPRRWGRWRLDSKRDDGGLGSRHAEFSFEAFGLTHAGRVDELETSEERQVGKDHGKVEGSCREGVEER